MKGASAVNKAGRPVRIVIDGWKKLGHTQSEPSDCGAVRGHVT